MKAGDKANAVIFMKKYKDGLTKYNAILAEYPDVKETLAPATAGTSKPKPAAPVKKELTLEEIYDKYHDAEQTVAMSLIEKEVKRCTQVMNSSKDQELKDIMEARIEQLNTNQESTMGDIQCQMLDAAGYLKLVKKYLKWEEANLKRA